MIELAIAWAALLLGYALGVLVTAHLLKEDDDEHPV
jgi:hypothetical protein